MTALQHCHLNGTGSMKNSSKDWKWIKQSVFTEDMIMHFKIQTVTKLECMNFARLHVQKASHFYIK